MESINEAVEMKVDDVIDVVNVERTEVPTIPISVNPAKKGSLLKKIAVGAGAAGMIVGAVVLGIAKSKKRRSEEDDSYDEDEYEEECEDYEEVNGDDEESAETAEE